MGIGYTVIVSEAEAEKGIAVLKESGYNCYTIGTIRKGHEGVAYA